MQIDSMHDKKNSPSGSHEHPVLDSSEKYLVRPASPEEAGLFYAQTPELDEALGAIGHIRIDFGHGGREFWHTWHPRGAEELNSPEFKAELDEVVGQFRESVLQDLSSMRSYCYHHGGEIEGDYQAYLSCFDKQAQELSKEETLVGRGSFAGGDQMQGTTDLKITDYFGNPVTLRPRIELYSVTDFMGEELPGLAIVFDKIGDSPIELEQYAFLTVSFGEHISIKNSAYIDTNNCPFAEQLLEQGIAEPTGFCKTSGFCKYPLWVFKEEFLQAVGGENYQEYAKIYDQHMEPSEENKEGLECLCQQPPKQLVGRVSFASGERIEYTDPAKYLRAVKEELPYQSSSGFRFETLTSDPEVRKTVDDMLYDLYGEENPRTLEDYQEQPEQGMTMGGM